MKLSLKQSVILALGIAATADSCQEFQDQKTIDECYMKIALDYALIHNPGFPFGALIVDHTKNDISCYGANSNKKNKLLHGETAAFWKYVSSYLMTMLTKLTLVYSCTEMYPSPTNDDMFNPGLDWSHQTLYTTGEPVSY